MSHMAIKINLNFKLNLNLNKSNTVKNGKINKNHESHDHHNWVKAELPTRPLA